MRPLLLSASGIIIVHMSFSDTIFLFFLALILFGPKKLPEIARQAGRLLAELRRASNEFRSQIESEIARLEVEKSQNAQASAPATLSLNPVPQESVPRQKQSATLAEPSAQTSSDSAVQAASEPAASAPSQGTPDVTTATHQESHV